MQPKASWTISTSTVQSQFLSLLWFFFALPLIPYELPQALKHAQSQLRISAGVETCIDLLQTHIWRSNTDKGNCKSPPGLKRAYTQVHIAFGSPPALKLAQTKLQVATHTPNMKKLTSKSTPPALYHAQTQLQIIAVAETCTNANPYRSHRTSGAQACTNVTPRHPRRRDILKCKSFRIVQHVAHQHVACITKLLKSRPIWIQRVA